MLPIQNLNGYDHPWAGGAGKNVSDPERRSLFSGAVLDSYDDATATYTVSGSQSYSAMHLNIDLEAGVTYTFSANFPRESGGRIGLRKPGETTIVSGTVTRSDEATGWAFFTYTPEEAGTGYRFVLFVNYNSAVENQVTFSNCMVEVGSERTAFEPYENVCPIKGAVSATLTQIGKNLLYNSGAATSTQNGVTFAKNSTDGTVTATGVNSGSATSLYLININLPAGNYLFNAGVLNSALANAYVTMDGASTRAKKWDGTTSSEVSTGLLEQIKIEEGHTYKMYLRVRTGVDTGSGVVFRPMVCAAFETDNTFAPYSSTTYPVSFGQTVYGGTYDFITGKLTVTYGQIAAYDGETINEPWISDRDAYVEGTVPTTGAQVAYPLSEPTTVQLTPQEITTLYGTNNFRVTITENGALGMMMSSPEPAGE